MAYTKRGKAKARAFASQRNADSVFEADLRDHTFKDTENCEYHPDRIDYTVSHKYEPDFVIDGKIIVEAKGRFRDSAEAAKYKWIRDHLEEGQELIFLFMKPFLAMPFAKKRKDGTKQTHSGWAEKNGFRWCTSLNVHELIEEIRNERKEEEG